MLPMARFFLILGVIFLLIGGFLILAGRVNLPLGRLPGDIRLQGQHWTCLIPLATSIILSILLTLILNLLIRFFGRK